MSNKQQDSMKFEVGSLYEVKEDIVSLIMDPNNENEPHPLFKDNAEQACVTKGVKFYVTEVLEVEKDDEWPMITENQEDVVMEKSDSYTMKVLFPLIDQMGIVFLMSKMLERKEIVEVKE